MPGASGETRDAAAEGQQSLLVEKFGDHVLHVTLNRPDRLNAVDRPMRAELVTLWQRVKQRTDIRAIVVTGAGSRAFCVGMDLKSLVADGGFPEVPERLADHVGINPLRHQLWTPFVVAVNGVCTGAGLQLVADADVVVASTNASFLDTHVSVGQVSALEPIALVPRIGLGRTLKMCLLGKEGRIDAEEALRIGLVDELVAPEELHERSLAVARQISAASPNAVRLTKQAIRQSAQRPQAEAEQYGWDLLRRHRGHPDAMEGPRAFVEGRPPSWSDAWLETERNGENGDHGD
ncbi:MAG: enoyl-CoA hydratase/isomerase family protein [Trebonia sp.]|jgi:enoyl-CoA hydratase/carnithine racemase